MANRPQLPRAIEEALRWEPPITSIVRKAMRDTTLGGIAIDAGMNVNISVASANRDPARYSHPDAFDLERKNISHLTFGHGPHLCLGMHLARMETRVALNALFDRLPGLRLDPDAEQPKISGVAFRSPAALAVLFEQRKMAGDG
jgi:cytochrome P450